MSPQGSFPGADDRQFGLIETFRWRREEGYAHLPEHLARLERSASHFGFAFRVAAIEERLRVAAHDRDGVPSRVRLVLSRDGTMDVSASPLGPPTSSFRVTVAAARHPSSDPWLQHKTTWRDRYERPLADAAAATGADEVLFLNERGELCEGARSNLFLRRAGTLLTPPLACGLLPGTLRAHLLRTGEAAEAVLRPDDLAGSEWFLGNAVRGLVRATLISAQSHEETVQARRD